MHWIDPECLPETHGTVTQFLLNPHGALDGFVLNGERQIHFPPHLSAWVVRHIKPGDAIKVRGVKPRNADIVSAVSLIAKDGATCIDQGPQHGPHEHAKPEKPHMPMDVSGMVSMPLFGPKGELRGALLDDGTSLRMPPHAAAELAAYLEKGMHVQAWGHGVKTKHGRTIDVHEIAELVDAEDAA